MAKPEDISQDVWDRAEAVAKETARNALRDPLMPYFISAQPLIARAILSAVEEEREAQRADFIEWLRGWAKQRFGVWITHNTAKGAYVSFLAIRNRKGS
jgi:hypothetical protein